MNFPRFEVSQDLTDALASIGASWENLQQRSQEIVLFGSRAAGVAHERSDWDILCVGHGRTRRTKGIDLLWVSPEERCSRAWLEGELAGHVSRWGQWLVGEPTWREHAAPGAAARDEKRRRIARRVAVWERSWALCSERLQARYALALRRDLQRHDLLRGGEAVPPSAMLDQTWRDVSDRAAYLDELTGQAGVRTEFVLTNLLGCAR